MLDKAYAKQNSLALGDSVKISGAKYTVIGLVTSSAGSSSTANVYIPLAMAQKISDNVGKVNQIYVRAASSDDIAAVKSEIKTVMPKATVTTAQDLADQVSGMADIFGLGSHLLPNIPYFGPVQAAGVVIGITVIIIGFLMLIPQSHDPKKKKVQKKPKIIIDDDN